MYLPAHHRVDDIGQMRDLIRSRPFATLVSDGDDGLIATHLPTVLKADAGSHGVIECHVARPNGHWKHFSQPRDALMIFQGVEGYITPSWYATKAATGKVVPTWNYAAVHAYGRATVVDALDLARHVKELTDQFERPLAKPWAVSDAPDSYIEVMLRGIVGLRFEITRLEGKWKMSQNRDLADMHGVVAGLTARDGPHDQAIAAAVQDYLVAKEKL